MGPTKGYEKDVGFKATHQIIYPESAVDVDKSTYLVLSPFKILDMEWLISAFTIKHITSVENVPASQCSPLHISTVPTVSLTHAESTLMKLAYAARVLNVGNVPTEQCPHLLTARSVTPLSQGTENIKPTHTGCVIRPVAARKHSRLLTNTPRPALHTRHRHFHMKRSPSKLTGTLHANWPAAVLSTPLYTSTESALTAPMPQTPVHEPTLCGDRDQETILPLAIFRIQIIPRHRPFLRFAFDSQVYQYTVLPFGLSLAPRTFTKCMDAALAPLKSQGMRILNYLDDWLILAQSEIELISHRTEYLLSHLESLGLTVNWTKSSLLPSQTTSFLGIDLDSVSLRARLSMQRARRVRHLAASFRTGSLVPLKTFQRMLGCMASAAAVLQLGLLRMRPLQHWQL
ncbi:unnamed protein product [Leuciscus chuanchicus]